MKRQLTTCLLVLLWLVAFDSSNGAVVTVDTGSDPIDIDWQTATIADLPGPDGKVSFSEAMIATSNTPGADTVEFAIPESDWQMQWLYPGYAAIYSSYTYFWRSSESVTIDGTTQEAFTGDRHPGEAELMFYGSEIYLSGGNSTFKGVRGGAVTLSGSNNLAESNTGGIHITVGGGSGSEIRGNNCGTIKLDNSNNSTVVGNVMQRVRIWGSGGTGSSGDGNMVGGPDIADRNFITGYGYVNSEGLPSGSALQLAGVSNTLIENNWIGTTVDGLAQGNLSGNMGISFEGTNSNTIIRDNRIAGILGHGQGPHHAGQLFGWAVMIGGSGAGITITGNTIGLDANDEPLLGSVWGIDVGTWNYATIDDITIEDNKIAGHYFNGITVGRDVAQVRMARNETYANGWVGIDLIPTGYGYGVTPNDLLDTDAGGNGLQNFPVLTDATSNGATMTVGGTLSSSPAGDFTLEFFASPGCDTTGHGEGQLYLGATSVTTDASGDAVFNAVLPSTAPGGWVLTATATLEPLGATSEFSACVGITEEISTNVADGSAPQRARLLGAQPNPFNPITKIRYELSTPAFVNIEIYNVSGRLVRGLVRQRQIAGQHEVLWDGRDESNRSLPSGSYFARLRAGALMQTVKLILVK